MFNSLRLLTSASASARACVRRVNAIVAEMPDWSSAIHKRNCDLGEAVYEAFMVEKLLRSQPDLRPQFVVDFVRGRNSSLLFKINNLRILLSFLQTSWFPSLMSS